MNFLFGAIALLMLVDRVWKHAAIIHFFHNEQHQPVPNPARVSIIQPILSGDPTLPICLEANLRIRSGYHIDFIWLLDEDDRTGIELCRSLIDRHPEQQVTLLTVPASSEPVCPKTAKNALGAAHSQAGIFCFVDDDVALKDGDLESCLPALDEPETGVAFGLPCYSDFSNFWSSLLSYFVNSFSLLIYIPASYLTKPFTINGQFFAITRERFNEVNGFSGIEYNLCDDFAIAQKFAAYGLHARQTPLITQISNHLNSPRQYFNLIRRWYIFPKESVMKYIRPRDLALTYTFGMASFLFPLVWLVYCLVVPSIWAIGYGLLYLACAYLQFLQLNRAYLKNASPLRGSWLVPVILVLFPVELLIALLSPNRIIWRGHTFQIERGGSFRYIQRRTGGR